jgi:type VI secretion system secreted protein VgrG
MSADSKTTPPSAAGGANPACGPTSPCKDKKCWPEDYDKEISVDTYGRYIRKYKPDGTTEVPLHDSVPFKIYAPVKSGTEITVEVRFKVEHDAGVSDADVASAKTKLQSGVNTHWNNKFKLLADDPECPSKTFKIVFKAVWVDSGQHYTIKVHNTYPREGVTGTDMDVSKSTTAWTYAHEFGHCFGLPDEYSYTPGETQTVKYIKPDGTLDSAISAPPDGKSNTAADATIMSAVDNTTTLPRHAWNIAIEVQDLLTQKLGRNIKCSIQ